MNKKVLHNSNNGNFPEAKIKECSLCKKVVLSAQRVEGFGISKDKIRENPDQQP